ncbi:MULTISPECIES: HNH endonuclease signature motif containing protein [unclassified Corynebacterium]|uniref:HNH endonuclease signature motif containing protein n=1 Tax=unclassified Corynebacterium TaxID=2624378 RepID=UPI00124CEAE2|nr:MULTISPECIES: HNH endonuclease signature motif containing protein [unclassified Corynebacterium]
MSVQRCHQLIRIIGDAYEELVELFDFDQGGTLSLAESLPALVELEKHKAVQAHLDILLCHLAGKENLTHVAGTNKPRRVLREHLGWSGRKITAAIGEASRLYSPVKDARIEAAETDPALDAEVKADVGLATDLRAISRKKLLTQHIGAEKRTLIDKQLLNLMAHNSLQTETLRAEAIDYAANHSFNATRSFLREKVASLNDTLEPDKEHAERNRFFTASKPDRHGGQRIHGYLPPRTCAKLRSHMDKHLRTTRDKDDARSLNQVMADAFDSAIGSHQNKGVFAISISAKDFETEDYQAANVSFPTDTGVSLSPADVLKVAEQKYGFVCVHDPETGQALSVRKVERLASFRDRIALLASELVCSHPDCNEPASRCQVHHLLAWKDGGKTELPNLTLLCPEHHSDNDDSRSNPHKTHAVRDPRTGRVGVTYPATATHPTPTITFNDSPDAQRSAGARIRQQPWPQPLHTEETTEWHYAS